MGERGAAVTRRSAAAAVVEGAGAMTLFRLLPSYANSWFLLAVFFSASAPPAFGGVWTSRAEDAIDKCLSIASGWFAFNDSPRIVGNTKQLAQRPITAVDLGNAKGPLRIVSHLPTVRRIKQDRDGGVGRSPVGVLLREAHKLICDATQRI